MSSEVMIVLGDGRPAALSLASANELEQLVTIHDHVAETDRALKSGAPGDVVMPVLIASIAA